MNEALVNLYKSYEIFSDQLGVNNENTIMVKQAMEKIETELNTSNQE